MEAWLPSRALKSTQKRLNREVDREMIAAIDFGTANCSLAYCIKKQEKVMSLNLNPDIPRVPTALLLKKEAGRCKIVSFGSRAQDHMMALSNQDHKNYHYFEFFKMEIHSQVCMLVCIVCACMRVCVCVCVCVCVRAQGAVT